VKAIPKANGLLLGGSHASSAAATQQVDDEVQESRFASWHASGNIIQRRKYDGTKMVPVLLFQKVNLSIIMYLIHPDERVVPRAF
jgi:hypothetical protein